jgi:hypothetical protein
MLNKKTHRTTRLLAGLLMTLIALNLFPARAVADIINSATLQTEEPGTVNFGCSVDLDVDTAIVGASESDLASLGQPVGAVFIFDRDGNGDWQQTAILTPPEDFHGRKYGETVGISGDYAVVGVGEWDAVDGPVSVYVYLKSQVGWVLDTVLTPPEQDVGNAGGFGTALAIDGTEIVVGAPLGNAQEAGGPGWGVAYVYSFDQNNGWLFDARMAPDAAPAIDPGGFGAAVDVFADRVIVGDPMTDQVFVYQHVAGEWIRSELITPVVDTGGDHCYTCGFGAAVAITNGLAAVGTPSHGSGGFLHCGIVHTYTLDNGQWGDPVELLADSLSADVYFGTAISLSNTWMAVRGGWNNNDFPVILYQYSNDAWSELGQFLPGDELRGIGTNGDRLVAGNNEQGVTSGRATLYEEEPVPLNDLEIESYTVDFRVNGQSVNPGDLYPYPSAQPPLTLEEVVTFLPTWDCVNDPNCDPRPAGASAVLEAVATPMAGGGEITRQLAVIPLDDSNIRYRNCAACLPVPATEITVDLLDPSLADWFNARTDAGDSVVFRLTLDPDGQVAESDETNNSSELAVPALLPYDGNLGFGPVVTELLSVQALERNPACGTVNSGSGSNLPDLALTGEVRWNPSANSAWSPVDFSVNLWCVKFKLNAASPDFRLWSLDNIRLGATTGTVGDVQVTVGETILDVNPLTGGAVPVESKVQAQLPEFHSYHQSYQRNNVDYPRARGVRVVEMTTSGGVFLDYGNLTASISGGFLHSRYLPFSLELDTLTLDGTGLHGTFQQTRYHYDLYFNANDPRNNNGVVSNDVVFSTGQAGQKSFTLPASGLSFTTSFAGATGKAHFPRSELFWQGFSMEAEQGALKDGQVVGINKIRMDFSGQCGLCDSADDPAIPVYEFVVDNDTRAGIRSDGTWSVAVPMPGEPQWGRYDGSANKRLFSRYGDTGKQGLFLMPGFIGKDTGGIGDIPVVQALYGVNRVSLVSVNNSNRYQPDTGWPASSRNAMDGNGWFAGFNLGVESMAGSPRLGLGTSLDGTRTLIGLGGQIDGNSLRVVQNIGTKYVLRPGGLTGVFNSDISTDPAVATKIYEYDFRFRRFAFRQVNNRIDEYSWLDGNVDVPGKGLFSVSFSSLNLLCTGHLTKGTVDYDKRNVSFAGWQTKADLLNLTFKPASAADASTDTATCDNGQRQLFLDSKVYIKAFSKPLDMAAYWTHQGNPDHVRIKAGGQMELDRYGSKSGVTVMLRPEVTMATVIKNNQDTNTDGWFGLKGLLGLPFWEMAEVDIRAANKTVTSSAQTIIGKPDSLLGTTPTFEKPGEKTNDELADAMKEKGVFDLVYTWGKTGFSMGFPVYYEKGRQAPKFLGVTKKTDLLVMKLDGGVKFVDPEQTSVVYGASANFKELAGVDFSLDLNDPSSFKEIDSIICNFPGIDKCDPTNHGPVQYYLQQLKDHRKAATEFLGKGLEELIQKSLVSAFSEEVNGKEQPLPAFQSLADFLGEINSAPEKILGGGLDTMSMRYRIRNRWGETLKKNGLVDTWAKDVFTDWTQAMASGDNVALAVFLVRNKQVRLSLDDSAAMLREIQLECDRVKVQMDKAVTDYIELLKTMETILTTVQDVIKALDTACGIDFDASTKPSHPILSQVWRVNKKLKELIENIGKPRLLQMAKVLNKIPGLEIDLKGAEKMDASVNKASKTMEKGRSALITFLKFLICDPGQDSKKLREVYNVLKLAVDQIKITSNTTKSLVEQAKGRLIPETKRTQSKIRQALQVISGLQAMTTNIDRWTNAMINQGQVSEFKYGTVVELKNLLHNKLIKLTAGKGVARFNWGQNPEWFPSLLHDRYVVQLEAAVAKMANAFKQPMTKSITRYLPKNSDYKAAWEMPAQPTAVEVQKKLVKMAVNTPPVEFLVKRVGKVVSAIFDDLDKPLTSITDFANTYVKKAVSRLTKGVSDVINKASGKISNGLGLQSGKVDGNALVTRAGLQKIHIGAEWVMGKKAKDKKKKASTSKFGAAFDLTSWSANNKAKGCGLDTGSSSPMDARISASGLKFSLGSSKARIDDLYLGFTIKELVPIGLFGGIRIDGAITVVQAKKNKQVGIKVSDIAFAAGAGQLESYLGARASATVSKASMHVAFLAGKTCNLEVIKALDPKVGSFITLPGGVFEGAYVRGGAAIPIYGQGNCAFTVGIIADAGLWYLVGPPEVIGGIIGGGAYGKLSCIAALRGQLTAYLQATDGKVTFKGDGWAAAGIGFCEPVEWKNKEKSRQDDGCGTGDVSFTATYKEDKWDVKSEAPSAIH